MISQKWKDIFCLPLRLLFDHQRVRSWGLTSILDERINIALKHVSGYVLDIGCGEGNEFLRIYGNGFGIDIYPWSRVDVCCNSTNLPFNDGAFDSVTFIVSLQYIKERLMALKETSRVLKAGGKILVIVPNPIVGFVRRKLAWWDKYRGEDVKGLWKSEVKDLMEQAGLHLKQAIPFVYGLNKLYIGRKVGLSRLPNVGMRGLN